MIGALVELRDASLGYGGRPVLEHVSFSIERGESVALVGPNGAGKTTLLRGLLGLIPVQAGRIVYGFDRGRNPPAYVPQRDVLDPIFPLSAMEVVLMGTYARLPPLLGPGARLRRLAADSLAQVGLASAGKRPFKALSGGQRQRVLIARALAVEPEIMLLDEPTAGLDHESETAITDLLARLHRAHGLTVVLVTHHLDRVRRWIRSAVLVDDGRAGKQPIEAVRLPEAPAALHGPTGGAP
jgi:ABC-type Mn2+/Zn2+ transport system ATPase subunit